MGKQITFVLREIDEKTAEDPEKNRTYYKLTPSGNLEGEVELKIKSTDALSELNLSERIGDTVSVEFGVKTKQTSIEAK